MRKKALILSMALSAAVALPGALLAHGTGNKVVGTVSAVHASMNHFEVKTRDGHTVGIKVADSTKFTIAGKAASLADLKEGARVVVTTTGEGDERTATLVKVGGAPTTAAKAPAHRH
jgi:hypothetical protein